MCLIIIGIKNIIFVLHPMVLNYLPKHLMIVTVFSFYGVLFVIL